ncbi:MAG: phosphoribosylformylglycinamidine synthase [Candidatus Cloacimonetes bacterium]|nr:phosphoribosylformylglycinamidine synthase [Candidatus Cloacimonadota bacterium]
MVNKENHNFVEIFLKEEIEEVKGQKIARKAKAYLNLNTGRIKTGKLFYIHYDLSAKQVEDFANHALKDNILHQIFVNEHYRDENFSSFILVAKLPGVTDDEGISAQKTMADYFNIDLDTTTQHIFSQQLYFIENELTKAQMQRLAEEVLGNKLINHFEYGKQRIEANYIPEVHLHSDKTVSYIDILVNDAKLLKISDDRLLSLNLEELKAIKHYYSDPQIQEIRKDIGLKTQPTDCEMEIFGQTWSEHCKHKEFNAIIEYKNLDTNETETVDSLFKTYIKGSTDVIQQRLKKAGNNWLIKVFSDNAGVVRVDENRLFVWKVETHNSPSAIDPYGGAITGILGNNRDPLGTGVGGAELIFNTDVLCFGSPFYEKELLKGQLHPKRVFAGVRQGIEDGGNKSGIPTVNGSIIFDDRYSGKPLVYCGTGGIMPEQYKGQDSWKKEIDPGDHIIMAGGLVGKDGIHGATFSSAEIDESSPASAVQIGSPITQKLLSDFIIDATRKGLIKCSTDNGAGGLSSSVGELARISGGAFVDLAKVPLKYSGLKPWEIFISESQERMTLVIEKENLTDLRTLAQKYEVEMTDIGNFTDSGFLEVRYDNMMVAYLKMDFLFNGTPRKKLAAEWQSPPTSEPQIGQVDHNDVLLKLLSSLNICSREEVIRQYDHEVKGRTVLKPLMGKEGKSPQDAAVVRVDNHSYEGIAVSNGIIPRYGDLDPYAMSAGSFDEAVRQIISIGGKLPDPLDDSSRFWSANDNFCVPDSVYDKNKNPDGKFKLGKLVNMNKALYDMAVFFNIPMTSGKDSMKNDFTAEGKKISVPPTILYSMAAKIDDIRNIVTSDFKVAGDLIYQLGETYNELGRSEFYKLFGEKGRNVPQVRKEKAKQLYELVVKANEKSLIESSHDLADGGLAVALAESCFGTGLGAKIDISSFTKLTPDFILFSESHSRFLVSIVPSNKEEFEDIFGERANLLGIVTSEAKLKIDYKGKNLVDTKISPLYDAWHNGLKEQT